jgi:(1->4)-alpha-D-glucan 1-alpha-D-glucosylmutase
VTGPWTPRATYRLQLRGGVDFAAAAALGPYLAALGVDALYLSPPFAAAPGSTHGYDVADPGTLEPALGGREGFARMARALATHGIGVVLDVVPNHMAAHAANPWWADALAWGPRSARAGHFDVDWTAERLILPILGAPYAAALAAREFRVEAEGGALRMAAGGQRLPLTPPSLALALDAAGEGASALALALADATPATAAEPLAALAALGEAALSALAGAVNADADRLHRLHEAQVWRLAHWRLGREAMVYRRFFEVTGLVGVRVEEPPVFDDVHRLTFALLAEGLVRGLRIDHVDGLADPAAYLRRLRAAAGPEVPVWVEKILHPGETLPPEWPVEGTTGYDFVADVAGLLTDPAAAAAFDGAWRAAAPPADAELGPLRDSAKRAILTRNLASELDALTDMAHAVARRRLPSRDIGRDTLRRTIIEMARALPVYRTYVDADGASPADRARIAAMAEAVRAAREVEADEAVDFVAALLALDLEGPEDRAAALRFARRFQQTTGPVTAKAVEDTAFYRYDRLLALNEVGCDPAVFGAPPDALHRALADRARDRPRAMLAGTTHDTKRGEDARARLHALTLDPDRWIAGVARWSRALDAAGVPPRPRGFDWALFQTILGAWPEDLDPGDAAGLAALSARVEAQVVKAAREAKSATSWTRVDEGYEAAARAAAAAALDPARAGALLADLHATCAPFRRAGAILSLGALAIRLAAPGIPDLYQGSEAGDFSLVDPDNRRPVDFAALARRLADDPHPKQALTRDLLQLRAAAPGLFATGACLPLACAPDDAAFAFARRSGASAVAVIVAVRQGAARLAGLRPAGPDTAHVDLAPLADLRPTGAGPRGGARPRTGPLRVALGPEPLVLTFGA